jgi:hypothetical protein
LLEQLDLKRTALPSDLSLTDEAELSDISAEWDVACDVEPAPVLPVTASAQPQITTEPVALADGASSETTRKDSIVLLKIPAPNVEQKTPVPQDAAAVIRSALKVTPEPLAEAIPKTIPSKAPSPQAHQPQTQSVQSVPLTEVRNELQSIASTLQSWIHQQQHAKSDSATDHLQNMERQMVDRILMLVSDHDRQTEKVYQTLDERMGDINHAVQALNAAHQVDQERWQVQQFDLKSQQVRL